MRSRYRHVLRLSLALAMLLPLACTSSSTNVVEPSGAKCELNVSNSPSSFQSSGGSGSLTITTSRDCTWSVATDASWLTIGGSAAGQGGSTIPYAVAANPTPAARSASLIVGQQRAGVSQAGAPCQFTLSRTEDTIAAAGGPLSVGVTAMSGCAWTAAAQVAWITISSGQSGNGSGNVAVAVASNTAAQARTGTVVIAGVTYTVSQTPPVPAPPTVQPPQPAPPVNLSGAIAGVSGSCPNLGFTVAGVRVTTNQNTSFTKMKCSDAKNGVTVAVTGDKAADGSVLATSVQKVG